MFEYVTNNVEGHLVIRDNITREVLADRRNAIHFGNISWAITQALSGAEVGHINFMVFGSGGTSVDSVGNISYRSPNTSNLQDPSAQPYQPTFWKGLAGGSLEVIESSTNFSDLRSTVVIAFGEPNILNPEIYQDSIATASTTNDTYVFDEISLYTGTTMGSLGTLNVPGSFDFAPDGRMVSHVIFHPVQKAANRELEIEYTIRVQMGS